VSTDHPTGTWRVSPGRGCPDQAVQRNTCCPDGRRSDAARLLGCLTNGLRAPKRMGDHGATRTRAIAGSLHSLLCPPKPYEVTWLTPTTGPRSQGKPYLTIYGADMTLRESPPGAELRVDGFTYASSAASSSGPRLRHIAGGLRPAHPTGDRRPARHIQTLCPLGRREGQAPSSARPRLHAVGASHFPSNI
jgi:hypothetical protein